MLQLITCNAGSSNIKLAAFDADTLALIARVQVEGCDAALAWLAARDIASIQAAGHRVVHGGREFCQPVLVTDTILTALEALIPLAPLHQPHNLALIAALRKRFPALPNIACFDTAFHRTLPEIERRYAIPRALHEEGLQRYGFHGLSYAYIASVLPEFLGARAEGKVIVAHLGNGASVCGMVNRQSRATSMGLSTLDGLMMGTRCGAIDPGVLLHLQQQKRLDADAVADVLYHQSGLKGVSGVSNDVRTLLASGEKSAQEALQLFALMAAKQIAQVVVSLGGIDALVFTGGIGENAARVRADIMQHMRVFGLVIDVEANNNNTPCISSGGSNVAAYVIPTNEELVIAKASAAVGKKWKC